MLIALWLLFICGLTASIHLYGQLDRQQQADVIIVLGAGLRRDGRPGPALIRRGSQAADLWHAGVAPRLICTGGFPTTFITRSEADACFDVLTERGVPADAIIMEENSRSTHENAVYSRQIMTENDWETAVVVSDSYHMLRATWIFSTIGIDMVSSPAEIMPPPGNYVSSVLREVVALHWQAVVFTFNLPFTFVPWL